MLRCCRQRDFPTRMVYIANKSYLGADWKNGTRKQPFTLAGGKSCLDLKVKILNECCQFKLKRMAIGHRSPVVKKKAPGFHLRPWRTSKFVSARSKLSDRFRKDNFDAALRQGSENKVSLKLANVDMRMKMFQKLRGCRTNSKTKKAFTKKYICKNCMQMFKNTSDNSSIKIQDHSGCKEILRKQSKQVNRLSSNENIISSKDLRHKLNRKKMLRYEEDNFPEYTGTLETIRKLEHRVSLQESIFNCVSYREETKNLADKCFDTVDLVKLCTNSISELESSENAMKTITNDNIRCKILHKTQNKKQTSGCVGDTLPPQGNNFKFGVNITKTIFNDDIDLRQHAEKICQSPSIFKSSRNFISKLNKQSDPIKGAELKIPDARSITVKSKSSKCQRQSDSSDDESENRHPNRRLQKERLNIAESNLVAHCRPDNSSSGFEQCQKRGKIHKASEMWEDILGTPDLWKVEKRPSVELKCKENDCEKIDYQTMLENFVFDDLEEKIRTKGDSLYEKRFLQKLDDPDFKHLTSEFFIPPAQVEVFYQRLTDSLTAQECLREVCQARKWPEPKYVQLCQPDGFKFCCQLLTRKFVPTKSSSNKTLARELAASHCLNWLGLTQRRSDNSPYCELTKGTYFG